MPRGRFTEKEVRNAILNKIDPEIKKSRSAHNIGYVSLNGKKVLRVKIPNPHSKDFYPKKANRLAGVLKLKLDEFHDLIACPLSRDGYYDILRGKVEV